MAAPLSAAIGRYTVEAELGRGAMGVIYRGHDPVIDRAVAIKVIAADLLGSEEGEAFLQRFRREAQAAARCAHPNIVAVYDYGLHDGCPFMIMEYVEGVSLRQALKGGVRLAPAQATAIMLQLLDALECAHAGGVVHRDVKPANILIAPDGRVKVADFGISRIDGSELTALGELMGTPGYMSPEQCEGLEVDARTDIFAAAAVLFELISGERAFPGSSFPEVRRRIVQEPTPRLPPPVEGVAAGIAGVIARGLAKLPEQRFASAREMAETLRAVAGGSAAAHAQQDDWATIVQPGPAAASPTGLRAPAPETRPGSLTQSGVGATSGGSGTIGGFGSALLTTLERALGRSVGPIARVLVRRAAAASPTVEALVQTLSAEIAEMSARQAFLEEAQRASATAASAVRRVDAAEVERAQRALTLHLGPVSRVLASRAAGQAGSVDELWRILSASIEDAAERARFMARRGN